MSSANEDQCKKDSEVVYLKNLGLRKGKNSDTCINNR